MSLVCEYPLVRPDLDVYHYVDVRLHHNMMIKIGLSSCRRPNFSCTYFPDTCITPPFGGFSASLASATFATTCLPESVALFPSPEVGSETTSVSVEGDLSRRLTTLPSSSVMSASSTSPTSSLPSSVVLPRKRLTLSAQVCNEPMILCCIYNGDQ